MSPRADGHVWTIRWLPPVDILCTCTVVSPLCCAFPPGGSFAPSSQMPCGPPRLPSPYRIFGALVFFEHGKHVDTMQTPEGVRELWDF